MALKRADYQDADGRWKAVYLPEEEPKENAEAGIPIGPPSLADLQLPPEVEVRLNNELFYRGILTPIDAIKRRQEISSAIMAALRVDTDRVHTLYVGKDFRAAKAVKQEVKQPVNGSRAPVRRNRVRR